MQIYKLSDCSTPVNDIPPRSAVALGFFDGVHVGHAELIHMTKEYAAENGVPVTVWTFAAMPKAEHLITTLNEKLDALYSVGVDYAVVEDFSAVRELSPDDFFDGYLMRILSPSAVFCGFNFRYGKEIKGTPETLLSSGEKHGVPVFVCPPYEKNGTVISSSLIRSLVSEGRLDEANPLLSSPYSVSGNVIRGHRLGHTLGFPTVNQIIPDEKIVPKHGVYAVTAIIDGKNYPAVANIGSRPTVSGGDDVTLETHIFGFGREIYGDRLMVVFHSMIREEKQFSSIDELSAQISIDCKKAQEILSENKQHIIT